MQLLLFGGNDYRIHFCFMTFIIVLKSNRRKTMTYQQSYHESNEKKCQEKSARYYKESKSRLKMGLDQYQSLTEEEKTKIKCGRN